VPVNIAEPFSDSESARRRDNATSISERAVRGQLESSGPRTDLSASSSVPLDRI
jgi:hypothetical protein